MKRNVTKTKLLVPAVFLALTLYAGGKADLEYAELHRFQSQTEDVYPDVVLEGPDYWLMLRTHIDGSGVPAPVQRRETGNEGLVKIFGADLTLDQVLTSISEWPEEVQEVRTFGTSGLTYCLFDFYAVVKNSSKSAEEVLLPVLRDLLKIDVVKMVDPEKRVYHMTFFTLGLQQAQINLEGTEFSPAALPGKSNTDREKGVYYCTMEQAFDHLGDRFPDNLYFLDFAIGQQDYDHYKEIVFPVPLAMEFSLEGFLELIRSWGGQIAEEDYFYYQVTYL